MDGLVAYVLAKKIAMSAVSGISNISLNGTQLVFQFKDGTSASMTIPLPEDGKDGVDGKDGENGISVQTLSINENGNLICLLSNGSVINAGTIPNPIVFVNSTEDLPVLGQISILYVAGTSIYIWTGSEYVELSSGGGGGSGTIQWGAF